MGAQHRAFAKAHRLRTAHWEPQRELGTSTSDSRVAPRHRLLSRPWGCPLKSLKSKVMGPVGARAGPACVWDPPHCPLLPPPRPQPSSAPLHTPARTATCCPAAPDSSCELIPGLRGQLQGILGHSWFWQRLGYPAIPLGLFWAGWVGADLGKGQFPPLIFREHRDRALLGFAKEMVGKLSPPGLFRFHQPLNLSSLSQGWWSLIRSRYAQRLRESGFSQQGWGPWG